MGVIPGITHLWPHLVQWGGQSKSTQNRHILGHADDKHWLVVNTVELVHDAAVN